MAIHQFSVAVIPEQALKEKYHKIPAELKPNADYINWWENVDISIPTLINSIDVLIPRDDFGDSSSFYWKIKGDVAYDHDVGLYLNDSGDKIETFGFRIALTDSTLVFLKGMLDICLSIPSYLLSKDNYLEPATIEGISKLIKKSRFYPRFKTPEGH